MTDLKIYQELVNSKAEENSSQILPNAGEKHAAIVMAKLFEKVRTNVNMVVGSFDGNVSDEQNYLDSLKICVETNKVPINILFLETPNQSSKTFLYLKEMKSKGSDITFKKAEDSVKKRFDKTKIHFSVFDDNKFRYERDTKKYIAWFSFNQPKISERLNKVFKSSFEKSPELSLA